MKGSLSIAASMLLVVGCTRRTTEYTGDLTDTSTIMKDARPVGPREASTRATMTIVAEKEKLSVVVKGCRLTLAPTSKVGEAEVTPGQTCRLSALGYDGVANAKGTVLRDGKWLIASFSFKPSEPDLEGNLAVKFSGPAY